MPELSPLTRDIATLLRHHLRRLLVFHLAYSGLATAILLPAAGTLLVAVRQLRPATALTTGDIVAFLTSPGGALWLLAAVTVAAGLLVLQHAGMVVLTHITHAGAYHATLITLWTLARRSPALLRLLSLQVIGHVLMAAPPLALLLAAWQWLVVPYDWAYLRTDSPVAFATFLAVSVIATLTAIIANGWLYLRWAVAVAVLVLEGGGALRALRRSATLTRGRRGKLAVALLGTMGAALAAPVVFTVVYGYAGGWFLAMLPDRMSVVAPAVYAYLIVYVLGALIVTFLGFALNSTLLYAVYHGAVGTDPPMDLARPPRHGGALAWAGELALLALAVSQAHQAFLGFQGEDTVAVTAHRGSSIKAPDNTLAAIEQAIEDQADYIEVDVRSTADGVLVLWHDAHLRRVDGRTERVRDLPYSELRDREIGEAFATAHADTRIPTLREAIRHIRGRARLYLDVKADPAPRDLTRRIVALLREEDAVEGTVIASTERAVIQEAARREPRLSTTLFAEFILGRLDRQDFDALGLRHNRATPAQVAAARRHGHELHVWTVNRRREMSRFIDMGVDNIITDRPDVLVALLEERAALSDAERLLIKLRNWLRS
ncbi:glycerophosphodiester phosphodiesterase family protein [Arhodomonas sp. SL1]|uniref:glycerophosphodiester phosphodiesterase family protein n=1 Tax=Arhodomonas sp. SL1 TaxID=3425691 RepID=UPI003F885EA1